MPNPLNNELNLLEKQVRAAVIKDYLTAKGTKHCVCFTSGNSAKYLRLQGLTVLGVGDTQELQTRMWWTFNQIATLKVFDATSGHLPWPLMLEISERLKEQIKELPYRLVLPTGSGETLVCLKLAFPLTKFYAKYNLNPATEYSANAPLNKLVNLFAEEIYY